MNWRSFSVICLLCLTGCESSQPKDERSFSTIPRPANQAAGKASIKGTVTFRGKPAEGVRVLLCGSFLGMQLSGFKCDPKYGETVTDEKGAYTFSDLESNQFGEAGTSKEYIPVAVVDIDPPEYRFWQRSTSMMADGIAPKPDEAYEVKPLDLKTKAIRLLSPTKNEKIKDRRPTFLFDDYPDAVRYEIKLIRYYATAKDILLEFEKPGSQPSNDLPTGTYRWSVTAYDAKSEKLSDSGAEVVEFEILK